MENVLGIFKINFHLAIQNNLFLAIAYLHTVPMVRGIANLDAVHSAECLEQSVILIGMILLVPLNAPEQSKLLQEVVSTKKVQQWIILLIRLVMALLTLTAMTGIFAGIMIMNNCKFPYMPYTVGTLISETALGSAGLCAAVLSSSAVVGYLVSMGYFLFATAAGSGAAKIWLTGLSIFLMAVSLLYKKRTVKHF